MKKCFYVKKQNFQKLLVWDVNHSRKNAKSEFSLISNHRDLIPTLITVTIVFPICLCRKSPTSPTSEIISRRTGTRYVLSIKFQLCIPISRCTQQLPKYKLLSTQI